MKPSMNLFAVVLLTAALLTACSPKVHDPSEVKPVLAINPTATQPTQSTVSRASVPMASHSASTIALTPLSRVRRAMNANPSIDLRIDALDAIGASSRMAGDLRVSVYCAGALPETSTFEIPLSTRAQEATYYDTTLELYVVRVEPKFTREPAAGAKLLVTLRLVPSSGATLEASGNVAW